MTPRPWTPEPTRELIAADGRTVTYCLYGPSDGVPVVSLTGAPGIRWERPDVVEAFEEAGLRVLVPDRPGYGGSTRRPGRSVADIADDVRELAEAQDWRTFAVTGHSAGGPHALACAARLADSVTRCAVVAAIAPADVQDVDFPGRDKPGAGSGILLAVQGEEHLRPRLGQRGQEVVAALEAAAEQDDGSPGRRIRMRASYLDGLDGWVDDDLALVKPWGFDVSTITAPVAVWYSRTDDRVPTPHIAWQLAHIPTAEAHEYVGGHDPGPHDLRQILAWLSRP